MSQINISFTAKKMFLKKILKIYKHLYTSDDSKVL